MEFFDEIIAVLKLENSRKERVSLDMELLSELGKSKQNIVADNRTAENAINQEQRVERVADGNSNKIIDASFSAELTKHIQSAPVEVNASSNQEIDNLVLNCRGCELSKYRQHAINGAGNLNSRLMFIGEAPSAADDDANRLFSGDVGELLDKMIVAMGFSGREEVYLTTLLKCRPPGNRVADKFEVEKCIGYLKKEIELIKPEAIVVFGANTIKYLIGKEGTISELRGKLLHYGNIPVMPTFNPAYLLRKAAAKREVWQDLQEVMKILRMQR